MVEENKTPSSLGAIARRFRIPAKWLRQEAEAGRIPHLKAGRVLLFDPEVVETALRLRLQESHNAWKAVSRGE